ncbi:MAG: phosphoenolpyruvate--protein phosphotransferase [Phycisphaerae bacterium]|nr:phosphoenolpyruvate--protein phosphotransferase [Phycisphaerae bacterium]
MEILKGIGVSHGVAICSAVVLDAEEVRIPQRHVVPSKTEVEIQRLRKAFLDATQEVSNLRVSQSDQWDSRIKDIFAVHLHFLRDKTLRKKIDDLLAEKCYTAEYAVSFVMREIAQHFSNEKDAYISERANDIIDIEKRLLRHLLGEKRKDLKNLRDPVVVVGYDLSPTQTASFDKRYIKGFAIDAGGRTSHTAIVAKTLGIPAVVALGNISTLVTSGDTVIVDGTRGRVVINPDEETIAEYRAFAADILQASIELDVLKDMPAETLDGEIIELMANIEFPKEALTTLEKGGDGIGLYRTEFLYLDAPKEPEEETQYKVYVETLKNMGDKPVTFRTVDLGGDKFPRNIKMIREKNPYLGLRSIRYCLQHMDMFKTQIRALLRASVHGKTKIMFPLITNLMELRQAKWVVADVKEDLEEQGIPFDDNVEIGIMIETPAAALTADSLADEVDFFSIGTNDLIQYTLAVDRVNEKVASLYSPLHPAVLQLLRKIVKVAKRSRIDLSLCGEMASEPEFTPLLLGLGFDTLSLAAPMIPEIKQIIRSVSMEYCRDVARRALKFDTDTQTISYLREELRKIQKREI